MATPCCAESHDACAEINDVSVHGCKNIRPSIAVCVVARLLRVVSQNAQHTAGQCTTRGDQIVFQQLLFAVVTLTRQNDFGPRGSSAVMVECETSAMLGFAQDDFGCPICMSMFKDPFVTDCGHSFCFQCITTHLLNKKSCPCCSTYVTADKIHPNFVLHKVCYVYVQAVTTKS